MKFLAPLALFGVVVFGALSVFAQSSELVMNALNNLTNIANTAERTVHATTQDNAYLQAFKVGYEFTRIIEGAYGHIVEFVQYEPVPFPDDVAENVVSAFGDHVHSYRGFLDALVEKHDILVDVEASPFGPDGRPIAVILPPMQFFIDIFQWLVLRLIPTRKEETDVLIWELYYAYQNATGKYPVPKDSNKMLFRTQI